MTLIIVILVVLALQIPLSMLIGGFIKFGAP